MRVLLVKPRSSAVHFGLAPFFRTEPLGLEYIWDQFDLHHLLWKPRLTVERFFELLSETWRRTVLNAGGRKKWWQWLRNADLRNTGHMARILARAQKSMGPQAYLAECGLPKDPR